MISVVVATYNGERFLEKQLDSILHQTRPADQVIIRDDGSTDNTVALAERFIQEHHLEGGWRLVRAEQNEGYCLNFLRGIALAQGDLIFLSDQDDLWLPEKIACMAQAMEQNPDIWCLSSRYAVVDQAGRPVEHPEVTYLDTKDDGNIEPVAVSELIGCSWIRGFSLCFKRELQPLLQPVDLKDLMGHDWYICILAALMGKLCFLNLPLTLYRAHGTNVSMEQQNRKTLLGDRCKRLRGLEQSIAVHQQLSMRDFPHKTEQDQKAFAEQIRLEQKRLRFLRSKKFKHYLALVPYLFSYRRYYHSFVKGLRVFAGDFLYGYHQQK